MYMKAQLTVHSAPGVGTKYRRLNGANEMNFFLFYLCYPRGYPAKEYYIFVAAPAKGGVDERHHMSTGDTVGSFLRGSRRWKKKCDCDRRKWVCEPPLHCIQMMNYGGYIGWTTVTPIITASHWSPDQFSCDFSWHRKRRDPE